MTEFFSWLARNWGWLLGAGVLGAYFALYVLAVRKQRENPAKPVLPGDRC